MHESKSTQFFLISCVAFLSWLSFTNPTQAQISSDDTTNTVVERSDNGQDITMRGGVRAESLDSQNRNLFHSFSSFTVFLGETATFADVLDINNIFSRVTGGESSTINGTISVDSNSSANLFLINPYGIIFGPGTILDINGSFIASTASNIQFDGGSFGVEGPQTLPSLLVEVPIGLQFGSRAEPILSSPGTTLNIDLGNTLAIIGGDIRLSDSDLNAPAGRIELISLSAGNTAKASGSGAMFFFETDNDPSLQNIYLENGSVLSTSVDIDSPLPNGDIELSGSRIYIDRSSITSANRSILIDTEPGNVGTINIVASDLVEISNGSSVTTPNEGSVLTPDFLSFSKKGANLAGGNISIVSDQINVFNSMINSSVVFQGRAGNIDLRANELVHISGRVQIAAANLVDPSPNTDLSSVNSDSAGNITIEANNLIIESGSQVNSSTLLNGGIAGNIEIRAHESLQIRGAVQAENGPINSGLFVINQGSSDAGSLKITSENILVEDRGIINAETRGQGIAGILEIYTGQLTAQSGGQITASTQIGRAGSVIINAPAGLVEVSGQGSLIAARATGLGGDAGSLTIDAGVVIVQDGAEISAATVSGVGGNVTLQGLRTLDINNAQISASTETGTAGNLAINANEAPAHSVMLQGMVLNDQGQLLADAEGQPIRAGLSVQATAGGRAGNLQVNTVQLTVEDGAAITVSSEAGQAGNLGISAETILLDNGSLRAVTGITLPGELGANIFLSDVLLLRLSDGSLVSASALAKANGGNVTIDASQGYVIATINENNDITANAIRGTGGNINITALGIYNFEERDAVPGNGTNDIDASSDFGLNGSVTINDPTTNPSRSRTELPETVLDARDLIDRSCSVDLGQGRNSFVVTGRGGLPPSPEDIVRSDNAGLADLGPVAEAASNNLVGSGSEGLTETTSSPPPQIVEAQTWYRAANGTAVLTAHRPERTGDFSLPIQTFCDRS